MKINFNDEQTIKLIEKALGFTLYRWQRRYLCLDDMEINTDYRCCGNSTIYIVKQLLTLDRKLNLKCSSNDIELLIDHKSKSVNMKKIMKPMIESIDYKLKSVGFETCLVELRTTNLVVEKQSECNEPLIAYKPVNEWEQAFNTLKNASDNSELKLSDTEIGNLVYHLGKTGIIGVDLSSTKDYTAIYGMDGLEYVIEND